MDDELKKNIMKTGTTTIGIVCSDGIVLAADKRATMGDGIFIGHKAVDKVLNITDKIAVTTAGNVSDIQLLVKLTKAELKLKNLRTKIESSVREAANLFAMLTYENIRKFSPLIGITAFLVGGVDESGFWLYDVMPDGSALEHKDFVSTGSGSVVAYGVLEDSYKKDLTLDEGAKLAVRALTATMQRDLPTGSGIDVIAIDKNGIKKVVAEEIRQVRMKR
jgi:proteasome beta subunit